MICLDTSVLIDYYRKKDKSKSFFYEVSKKSRKFAISSLTQYEIYVGSTESQDIFWDKFLENFQIIKYDSKVNKFAIRIYRELKIINKRIDTPDLLIAASAMSEDLNLATLNKKHFVRVNGLKLILKD